ncbi:EAL domain-containing protein [Paraburkholderia caballeronis]|uniref:Diguanylate cyclase (GGDEF) domain-containing protein n=1 Tax=Paraburkholderia caballeronis TaxID=416943 RepID=A0A1H7HLY9_9BURK|nr:phosphodiesterase [Paraburkholderia caballeronis]PXW29449.1 diguanylate cyclase/phosphodiesterase [Paraburkholderia caballeronis]PXX04708.1 diguanylate cyclase/phosphodiesterase [Paraburkholderia caballeronis]RAK05769.1 diguanylate cyclase/phosphodiesterase [Paraburkholderia caballeronis]SED02775.1 diguanylate cyclase/phosphodiesterase [Paraburkholderia caballeronis]SEK51291.1 diguanylate cyclase (GGDEF) domain-containing protein [Paraburkholderia caballeronis]
MPVSAPVSAAAASVVQNLIAQRSLRAVFQPIVDFSDGSIQGYEGLIRGPAGTSLESPAALFAQAAAQDCVIELEHEAARVCVEAFAELGYGGKLFLNFSARALSQLAEAPPVVFRLFERRRGDLSASAASAATGLADAPPAFDASRIVIELTEQSEMDDLRDFAPVIDMLRASGAQFALDDYGSAYSSMNVWVRLQPDVVKIDRFFIQDIANDTLKFEAVRAMMHFARASGARLIAEGIETEADLIVVRDMGIGSGQGYFLGRPAEHPPRMLAQQAREAVCAGHIAVFPETTRPAQTNPGGAAAAKMLVRAPALPREATNNDVLELFNRQPDLHALAVVENDRPIALINRRSFMDRYALPYHRELFGKKACMQFANASPVMIERSMTVEQMATLLASDDQRYLADGFVITDNGLYVGLGTGESLVRAVTEVRIQAARYANPLTFLPGNIPISSHIARLMEHDAGFHACYVDLNNFKPFNDQYGYWQGDEVLKFAASVLAEVCDPTRDFLGHVGGDDFMILFQSEDWQRRARRAIDTFNDGARRFYAPADQLAGGIHGEDRRGNPTFFTFVTMAIGCVRIAPGGGAAHNGSEAIASLAALAKRRAKYDPSGLFVIDGDAHATPQPDDAPAESD